MEMPKGWKQLRKSCSTGLYHGDFENNSRGEKLAEEYGSALDLMKEMAEALNTAAVWELPESFGNHKSDVEKALKKFKEWK
jgi:hypothetical protein